MKVFALYGKESIGKSTVLIEVCERLKKQYPHKPLPMDDTKDVCYVFEIDGKKVGVTSYGDNKACLEEPFAFFERERCDTILTASRIRYTRTGSALFIYDFADKYGGKPTWIHKDYVNTHHDSPSVYEAEINSINEKMVNYIISLITKTRVI